MANGTGIHGLAAKLILNAEQLVEQVSGRALSAQPFLAYLEAKIGRLSPAMSGSS